MPIAGLPAGAGRKGARVGPRFSAALIVSALVHAAFIGAASEPGTRLAHTSAAAHRFPLAARLISVESQPQSVALPESHVFPPEARRAAPVRRTPSARVSQARDAAPEEREDEPRITEAPDSTYYAARQLDSYPELVTALDLKFPANVDLAVSAGHVLLLVLIDAQGRVNDASVVEAAPPGVFEDAATHALLSARFKPAVKDGRAVRSRLVVHVTYGKPE